MLVFVYGTLLTDQRNNYLLAESRKVGDCRIYGLEMYDLGLFPACVISSNQENTVLGEVWEIDEATFQRLDWLEGYPDFYNREPVETPFGIAWVYICEQARGKSPIKGGDWKEHVRESDGL